MVPQIDFVISNNRHHVAMTRPVIERLARDSRYDCRVLSLCEIRGLSSPQEAFQIASVDFISLLPYRVRWSPSLGRQSREGSPGVIRRLVRTLTWRLFLDRALRAFFSRQPQLVVMPNDAAFPYDRLSRLLRCRDIPFLLLQEGIRFPIPAFSPEEEYGQGGAIAMAVWGEASARYFRRQGLPSDRVIITGSPRFDGLPGSDLDERARRAREQWGLSEKTLLLITNPIDDQGFCTSQEKKDLVRRFIAETEPLFEDPEFHLAIKIHARESVSQYRALIGSSRSRRRITILGDAPLYSLFSAARAAVVLASTAGLEALLFNLPLAVLEIPSTGFPYDYVDSGAAQGLSWAQPVAPQIHLLMTNPAQSSADREAYVSRQLACRDEAAIRVEQLIRRLVGTES